MKPQNKQEVITHKIARMLLFAKKGDKILSIKEYAAQFNVGIGTVQSAFSYLKLTDALSLQSRGAQGTYVDSLNPKKVWECSGLQEFLGLLPLSLSYLGSGLATGIYECFSSASLPVHILFSRGSANRLSTLESGRCDFAVISTLAYDQAIKKKNKIKKIAAFGDLSCRDDIFFIYSQKNTIPLKVGVDLYFFDHAVFFDELKKIKNLELVPLLHVELIDALKSGRVNGIIIERTNETEKLPEGDCVAFSSVSLNLAKKSSEAVLVIKGDDSIMQQLMKEIIDPETVRAVQHAVQLKEHPVRY
jgi:hypothetical protein